VDKVHATLRICKVQFGGGGVLGDMFSLVAQMIGEVWHALNLSGLDIT
jgi:hypothetical protein